MLIKGFSSQRIGWYRNFQEKQMKKHSICHFNDDNIHEAFAMIGGIPRPLSFGFYFFHIKFPNEYPLEPPGRIHHQRVQYTVQSQSLRGRQSVSRHWNCGDPVRPVALLSQHSIALNPESPPRIPYQSRPSLENCKGPPELFLQQGQGIRKCWCFYQYKVKKPPTCFWEASRHHEKRFWGKKNYYLEYLLTNTIIEKEKLRDDVQPVLPLNIFSAGLWYADSTQFKYLDVWKNGKDETEAAAAEQGCFCGW